MEACTCFSFPNTSSSAFLCTPDAQGGRVCQQLARFASSDQSPPPRSASPRTPGASGSTTRFQEWGPPALGMTFEGFFSPTTDSKSESNHHEGRYHSEEPQERLGQAPHKPSRLVSERLFRNLSPFHPSEPYTSLLLGIS